jgi:rhamnogalacturonan endolyase
VTEASLSASRNGISYRIPVSRASLAVLDVNGNIIFQKEVGRQGVIVQEWDALPAGSYIIGIRANGKFLAKISARKH